MTGKQKARWNQSFGKWGVNDMFGVPKLLKVYCPVCKNYRDEYEPTAGVNYRIKGYKNKYYKEKCKDKHLSQEKIDQILYNFDENNNVTCETKQKMKELLDIK